MADASIDYGIPAPAHRLPAATRLGAVRLQVSDLARSLDYYTDVLGLQIVVADRDRASLAPQDDDTPLVELQARSGVRPAPRGGRLGLFHFAILVPDRAALGRFLAHLGQRGIAVASADHAVSEALYLNDPDGLGIEVYADRPRETWRIAARELYMTTERLDLRGLLRAADGGAWTGMPAGTAMGHVHLHVGDLDAAAGFYHAALGFDQMVWSYPGALFLSAGGYHHHLGTNTWAAGAPPAGVDEARLLEWDVVLPDRAAVDAAAHALHGAGHATASDGDDHVARDPWGTALRLRAAAGQLGA